jgi:serine/threonine protein kinase
MVDRYERAKKLFLEVCDLAPGRRREAVEASCAGDAELLGEVLSLLEHHDEPRTATVPEPAPSAATARTEPAPERIGPYRIIREIGRGGMGVVYLAAREGDHLKRLAAVKLLKRGMDTQEILGRFEHERQVLATLNHHGIARLYEAGETDDGLPYFAMEHVEGQPIDEYCDTHRLRITERLELFRKVCEAVHFVHQNLMVHRDLKPRNILVTSGGVPKLLDFGIAKLINPDLSLLGGDPTAPELRIMTPEYASPEQMRGSPITVSSDIYSLGVILYELVTGHRPYHIRGRVRAEIARVICEVDPERPSTVATRLEVIEPAEPGSGTSTTIDPEIVAKLREGRPERLRRRLAGDIDNIVLMAMRKEPQRRYQSAEQFGEDIRRHLDGLPVTARHDTAGYRLAKFVRRHRQGVAAAAIVGAALVGWGVTAALGWAAESRHVEAVRQEQARTQQALDEARVLQRQLQDERDRTSRMFDEALRLAQAFLNLDDQLAYNSLEARRQLAETAQGSLEYLRSEIGDDPEILRALATAYNTVGDIWGGHRGETFGDTETALRNYRTALRLLGPLLAAHPDDANLRHEVATSHLRIGDMLKVTGDVRAALDSYDEYLRIARGLAKEDRRFRRPLALALDGVGAAHKKLGHIEQARRQYQDSLDLRRQVLGDDPDDVQAIRDVSVGWVHLGEALALLNDDAAALEAYRSSLDLRERLVRRDPDSGLDRRYLGLAHYFVADVLLRLDRPDEAAPHVEAAGAIFEERAWENPGSARAASQDLVLAREIRGRLQMARGDLEGALGTFERCKELAAGLVKKNPEQTFYGRLFCEVDERIGEVLGRMGNHSVAVAAYREALDTIGPLAEADRADVDLQVQTARILSALGGALIDAGSLPAARQHLEEAGSILETVLKASPRHARARRVLDLTRVRQSRAAAAGYALAGDPARAASAARQALDLLAAAIGPEARVLRAALEEDLATYDRAAAGGSP